MGFRFKQFDVDDSRTAMKVGTDAVLLGAWADVSAASSVVDIGAGCGVVSLMLAQRTEPGCRITGFEVDEGAAADCRANFGESVWADRLTVVCGDALSDDVWTGIGKADLLVSNPPFFAGDLAAPTASRALARQGDGLSATVVVEIGARRLRHGGRLAMVTDMRRIDDIEELARQLNFRVVRKCEVAGREGAKPLRMLWELRLGGPEVRTVETAIAVRDADGRWSEEYMDLTKDFYLNL